MFKYFMLKTLRNRGFIFWSLIFPIALMTCFHLAFGNIYEVENVVDPRDVAVVYEAEGEFPSGFEAMTEVLSKDSEDQKKLLNVTKKDTAADAEALLAESKVCGMFLVKEDDVEVVMNPKYSDTDAMILKSIASYYLREYKIIDEVMATGDQAKIDILTSELGKEIDMVSPEKTAFIETTDPYNWYFYSTVVMGILFQAMAGINLVSDLQADINRSAMRTSVSPTKKLGLVLSGFFARFIVSVMISATSLVYMNKVLGVPLGNRIGYLAVFVIVANMFSLSLGEMFGLFFKGNMTARGNKGTALIMTSVFLSGEMIATLPGVFEQNIPWLNDINPATILNMSLYKLVYYSDISFFYAEMAKILLLTVIFLGIATLRLRRQKYASL